MNRKTWPFASSFTAFRRAKGYLLQTVPPLLANRLVINYLQNEATFILNFIHAHNPWARFTGSLSCPAQVFVADAAP